MILILILMLGYYNLCKNTLYNVKISFQFGKHSQRYNFNVEEIHLEYTFEKHSHVL